MKAKYQEPMLAMESFSSTQPTSRDCADTFTTKTNLNDASTCKWDLGGGTSIFAADTCSINAATIDEAYCYNNPSENYYIFHS